jgi:hypothetical protein
VTFKDALKREIKYLPMWYILVSGIQMFIQMLQYWDTGEPVHSFIGLGPGVLLTVLFPLLWVIIFAFCREIASKNKIIKELEERKTKEASP